MYSPVKNTVCDVPVAIVLTCSSLNGGDLIRRKDRTSSGEPSALLSPDKPSLFPLLKNEMIY